MNSQLAWVLNETFRKYNHSVSILIDHIILRACLIVSLMMISKYAKIHILRQYIIIPEFGWLHMCIISTWIFLWVRRRGRCLCLMFKKIDSYLNCEGFGEPRISVGYLSYVFLIIRIVIFKFLFRYLVKSWSESVEVY